MRMKAVEGGEVIWNPGTANPKQKLFFESRTLYTAYGGAKGGGKTWAVRTKAIGGALCWEGIRILIMRRTYPELEENHIQPMLRSVPAELMSYNGTTRVMRFINGSTIKFGHWSGAISELEYQGQEFDWIFIDEATQFTERAFNYLGGCLRGTNVVPKRMYLTCNPGGVGHKWVKRLFIDREYRRNPERPEEDENPEDYTFIPATVEDNEFLLKSSPGYLKMLSSMPEDLRRAYRYGDWDALSGCYFSEVRRESHVMKDFRIPKHWVRYRSIDYGLDMLACCWVAVDEDGKSYVYREVKRSGLIVRSAAELIRRMTPESEDIAATFAPPDIWSRQKDSGKTMAELFCEYGVPLVKAENDRVQGHMVMKDMLCACAGGVPEVRFFESCKEFFEDVSTIQADEDNPSDCAKEPHEVTHAVDALRYYCVSRRMQAEPVAVVDDEECEGCSYEEFMLYRG